MPQKWIGCLFKTDGRWQGWQAPVAFRLFLADANGDIRVSWLYFLRKAQIGQGVLMRAVDMGCIGQCGQLFQRRKHLCRRAFEQPSAAAGKQGVAAKQPIPFRRKVGDMAMRMAGDIKDVQAEGWFRQRDIVALGQWTRDAGNRLVARTEHRDVELPEQLRHAADMVSMMMCQ